MKFSVHGCRGSIPVASTEKQYYGGNTSCYTIETERSLVIIDAGTGFKKVNLETNKECCLVFSHFHHDHLQGLPFNASLFANNNIIRAASELVTPDQLEIVIRNTFSPPYFPISLVDVADRFEFTTIDEINKILSSDLKIETLALNHPGGSTAFRIYNSDASVVCLCDNEYFAGQFDELKNFVAGSDLVIWDGMFTDDELQAKKGWGHSSIQQAVSFFEHSDAQRLLISHHDPSRTDDQLKELTKLLKKGVSFAREGLIMELTVATN
jgi:phosphoribosyl 1,2-cyclic phosphodiesterase